MSSEMKDFELNGHIDQNHRLVIEEKDLPLDPQDVTIIVRPKSSEDKKARFERLKALQGSLKGWDIDGVEYQREMRNEWDNR